jgi:eukaryotic-like serine/threonine-protein kinase
MLFFTCAACAARLQVPEELAGGNSCCPHCRAVQPVPAAALPLSWSGNLESQAALPPAASSENATLPPAPAALSEAATLAHEAPASSDTATLPQANGSANGVSSGIAIPGYELLSELGRGGMGVVYKARQRNLNRLVALKMILAGGHAAATERARFQTEAEAIARLQHPNIVQVHEVGDHEGKPYFSLEFCGGGSLERKLNGTPLPARAAAALVETLARAMHAAHTQQIIHRDLKPANVLLLEDGTPKITDFGLAKKLDEAGQTHAGAVMGTPSYMAPEQAGGQTVGPLADVYALGAILYECLTGRPPFKAATALDTIMQVASDEPVPPSQLQSRTPRDLETICLKCLQKEPRKRYGSALELAADLRRFLNGEPIRARPVGRFERGVKWVKRQPALAGMLAVVVLLTVVSFAIFVGLWLNADHERRRALKAQQSEAEQREIAIKAADQSRQDARAARTAETLADRRKTLAEEREQETQYQLATTNVLLSEALWDSHNVRAARERLAAVPLSLRKWEWHYLYRQYHGNILALRAHTDSIGSVAFSPDGARLATASLDMKAAVWDATTGQQLFQLSGHTGPVNSVAFSPDGTRLATACQDQKIRLWDARDGRQLQLLTGHTNSVSCVAFSPDGKLLASASHDNTARLWDAHTGAFLHELKGHALWVYKLAFSADSTRLATASADRTVRLWDAQTGEPLPVVIKGHQNPVFAVAFSPDGTRLATASSDGTERVWDARTGKQLFQLKGHTAPVHGVAFSPDGSQLATASDDQTVRLWDGHTGEPLRVLTGHTHAVKNLAFSPDGARLATAGADATVQVWDVRSDKQYREFKGHTGLVFSAAFSPDGTQLATASSDGKAALWDARTGQKLRVFKGHAGFVWSASLSPDGMLLATAGNDRTARLWDARTGEQLHVLRGHSDAVKNLAFSPDGTRLATAGADSNVRLWDVRTGQPLPVELKGHTNLVWSVAFSPDGTQLVTASSDRTARLWDARTGQPLHEFKGHANLVFCASFSPDGTRIATASGDQTARLWDARTGKQLSLLEGHTAQVTSVAFSPDGTRLATGSYDQTARLWDASTGQQLLQLKGHRNLVFSVSFSPDGSCLATASKDQTAGLWDARPAPSSPEEQLVDRRRATRSDPDWHEEQFRQTRTTDHFAAAFHLDRLLAYWPGQRSIWLRERTGVLEANLKQDNHDAVARLLLARTAWHTPSLGPKNPEELLRAVEDKQPLARRTRAGLLLRLKKAEEAVALLEAAQGERGDGSPPVEELLLAWAYLDTSRPDKAKEEWTKATRWLDSRQEAVRAANVIATVPGVLPGVTSLFAPPADPRYRALDWETWHELEVLRRELAPRFAESL